jgi:hypothetical protein
MPLDRIFPLTRPSYLLTKSAKVAPTREPYRPNPPAPPAFAPGNRTLEEKVGLGILCVAGATVVAMCLFVFLYIAYSMFQNL